ncbi:MAG: DUF3786 domain-containing protein [Oscillospiraceae bacterium]|nr:DUF3786 domain-containing protein [Oscillospiraceae bacterium]
MEIIDHKNGVPIEHYSAVFAFSDPESLSRSSGVPYEDGAFHMTLLGRELEIRWPDMTAMWKSNGEEARANVRILCARRILEGRAVSFGGRMLSYVEMPWGNVYQKQFDGRCVKRLAFGFGNSPDKFADACRGLNGIPANGGDAAFDILFLEGLIVRLTIWEGDDEFPPSAQILFSDNFPAAFSAEDIAVCGDILIDAMKGRW